MTPVSGAAHHLLIGYFRCMKPMALAWLLAVAVLPAKALVRPGAGTSYFASPLDSELVLNGTFGEIRADHFHSGIDLSTGEQTGATVLAAADGYISRIKISSVGFGNALYVTHPNGLITVYGHLGEFRDDIRKFALSQQYEKESFELDVPVEKKLLKVKKGEAIAWSGNSGSSGGPHLHFEIRDEKTEEPMNPLLFGLPVADTVAPVIRSLRVFPQIMNGLVELSDQPYSFPVRFVDGRYRVDVPDYIRVYGKAAFGIETDDADNAGRAVLGPYAVTLLAGADTLYRLVMDRFRFDETRYANACMDYSLYRREGTMVYRCYRLPGVTQLGPLKAAMTENDGFLLLNDEQAHPLTFSVSDAAGNSSTLQVDILATQSFGLPHFTTPPAGAVPLSPSQGAAIHKGECEVIVPKNAVYEPFSLVVDDQPAGEGYLSRKVTAGDPLVPLQESFSIGLRLLNPGDSLAAKAVVVRIERDGSRSSLGGQLSGDWLKATSRRFGVFAALPDTTAPGIHRLPPADPQPDSIAFIIQDDLSGIASYRATLNGKWMLMEYDAKNNRLAGNPARAAAYLKLPAPPWDFELTVTDERGNSATYRAATGR